jgi:hypothetical protein
MLFPYRYDNFGIPLIRLLDGKFIRTGSKKIYAGILKGLLASFPFILSVTF